MKKLTKLGGNLARQASTHDMLKRKVSVLRAMTSEDAVSQYFPSSITQLRKWSDDNLGLSKIGSPSSTNKNLSPQNSSLIDEAIGLISLLKLRSSKSSRSKPSITQQLEIKKQELIISQMLVKSLTSQIVKIRHEYYSAEVKIASLTSRLNSAESTNVDLRRQLVEALNSRLQAVK